MKQNIILVIALGLGLLITLGLSPFFVVDLTETAIVVALGKPVRTVTEPVFNLKFPSTTKSRFLINDSWIMTLQPEM